MLVSSVGYFNADVKRTAADNGGKNQARPLVTKGLDNNSSGNLTFFDNLKTAANNILNTFSKNTNDMKNSINMIA